MPWACVINDFLYCLKICGFPDIPRPVQLPKRWFASNFCPLSKKHNSRRAMFWMRIGISLSEKNNPSSTIGRHLLLGSKICLSRLAGMKPQSVFRLNTLSEKCFPWAAQQLLFHAAAVSLQLITSEPYAKQLLLWSSHPSMALLINDVFK